jgi:hypothetical protein
VARGRPKLLPNFSEFYFQIILEFFENSNFAVRDGYSDPKINSRVAVAFDVNPRP